MPSRRRSKAPGPAAYFLDTNIVMYAVGAPHPLRDPCRSALDRAVRLRVNLITDAEVLQEILHRYTAIGRLDMARSVYAAVTTLCDEVLSVAEKHTARALELLSEYPQLSARDGVHVATMEDGKVRRLLSTDGDFDTVDLVRRVDPAHFLV